MDEHALNAVSSAQPHAKRGRPHVSVMPIDNRVDVRTGFDAVTALPRFLLEPATARHSYEARYHAATADLPSDQKREPCCRYGFANIACAF